MNSTLDKNVRNSGMTKQQEKWIWGSLVVALAVIALAVWGYQRRSAEEHNAAVNAPNTPAEVAPNPPSEAVPNPSNPDTAASSRPVLPQESGTSRESSETAPPNSANENELSH